MSQGASQQPVPPAAQPPVDPPEARTWAMLCHLGGFGFVVAGLGQIIAPLVLWLVKKDQFDMVNDQGKEALNFQISISIYGFVAFLLCFVLIGFLVLPAVGIFDIVMIIIASIKANSGVRYRYPLCIRFIK